MLEPKFMGMASNNSSCSQNFEKWAWRVFLFLFIYFFLSDSGLNRPIRAETDRYRPKWTEIRVKKKVKKFGKTHRFEASLKKKTLSPISNSLSLSFSHSPPPPLSLSLSLSLTHGSHTHSLRFPSSRFCLTDQAHSSTLGLNLSNCRSQSRS